MDAGEVIAELSVHGISAMCSPVDHDDEYHHAVEAWKMGKKITVYVGKDMLLLRVWGPHIENEMSEHQCESIADLSPHIEWLQGK